MTAPDASPGVVRRGFRWRALLRWVVVLLVQGAVVFYIGRTFTEQWAGIRALPFLDGGFLLALALVSVLYGASLALPALAWTSLMVGFSDHAVRWRDGMWVFGKTLLGKYLPGNVFQFVGRHWLGTRLNWSQAAIWLSSIHEALIAVSAGALLTLIAAFWIDLPEFGGLAPRWYAPIALAATLAPWVFLQAWRLDVVRRFWGRWPLRLRTSGHAMVLWSFVAWLLFLMCSATFVWAIASSLTGNWELSGLGSVLAAYGLIYLLGFILPGAPGGLGVREAMIILMLGPQLGQSVTMATGLSFRLCTVVGELLFYVATIPLTPARKPEP